MSRKRKTYTAEFKTKVVLELLEGEKTLNEIAIPASLKSWKKQFLENASLAFSKSKVVKEYKEQIKDLEKKVDKYAKSVEKLGVLSKSMDVYDKNRYNKVIKQSSKDFNISSNLLLKVA